MSGGVTSGRVEGKVVVTGAARGIGRASAALLAQEGADVVGIDVAGPVSRTLEVASDGARVVSGASFEITGGDSAHLP